MPKGRGLHANYSDEFTQAWNSSLTISECITKLGLNKRSSATYTSVKNAAVSLGLTTNHMTGRAHGTSSLKSDAEFFVKGSLTKSYSVKRRALQKGYLSNVCAECGLEGTWNNKPITLQLDHINGDNTDNRLENLRILCPNCHSQTETYCGKHLKGNSYVVKKQYACKDCNTLLNHKATRCRECYSKRRAENIPSKENLLEALRLYEGNLVQTAKVYQVSDNGLRKWLNFHALPSRKKEIQEMLYKDL